MTQNPKEENVFKRRGWFTRTEPEVRLIRTEMYTLDLTNGKSQVTLANKFQQQSKCKSQIAVGYRVTGRAVRESEKITT